MCCTMQHELSDFPLNLTCLFLLIACFPEEISLKGKAHFPYW